MSQEVELKLAITPESVPAFLRLPLLGGKPTYSHPLKNTYFDTPERFLTQQGAALRVRQLPTGWVQTLKTRGQNVGGLHQRGEWEMPIPTSTLDLSLFPAESLPSVEPALFSPLFTTDFNRTAWQISFGHSEIELVLDVGTIESPVGEEAISELELELCSGDVADLFRLALVISQQVAVMPSDLSKAERGYRLLDPVFGSGVSLPDIQPEHSMEDAFTALFGYELERLQRHWQLFWSTHQWHYLQSFLNTLGNMQTQIDWFSALIPSTDVDWAVSQIQWVAEQMQPILSWWPACFALSQDAAETPDSLAVSLQQAKARKALARLDALRANPELGTHFIELSQWLHSKGWQTGQSSKQQRAALEPVSSGLGHHLGFAMADIQPDCFAGSASHALSQSQAVHRLWMMCRYFDRLYGHDLGPLRAPLASLEANLSKLSAMEVAARLKNWLAGLPFEQQASLQSWSRSQTILLRDIRKAANALLKGRVQTQGQSI